jgi:dolichol-phosphate mannosyltransferase
MISVIFPTYNEQDNLPVLHDRMNAVASKIPGHDFEFIFVDDCSTDHTPQILRALHAKDKRVKIIRLARNCGSHAAIAAGLIECQGDCAVVLAADLQDPPELLHSLVGAWQGGVKVVWGARRKRLGEKFTTKFFSRLYYWMMNYLTTVKVPPLGVDVFLAERVVIEAFKKVNEKHTSVFMVLAWLGFQQSTIHYVKEARWSGTSKWSLGQKIKLTLDSLLAFSDIFIRYMSVIGIFIAVTGFIYSLFVLWGFVNGSAIEGWSSLIVVILLVGGIQMIMLGVLGEYLWRTFDESRRRPRFIVEYKIGLEALSTPSDKFLYHCIPSPLRGEGEGEG